ncbi:MAG TPA: YgiT-type zinc finger protein [Phycisphaerae bacterium]|nr:YgiT-type zinc finger protein [Phycisphaerae bacterium]
MLTCDICGKKGARIHRVTRSCGRGRSTFFIENVPLVTCSPCGESYFTAETLHEIERIRLHWREFTVAKKMLIAQFGREA